MNKEFVKALSKENADIAIAESVKRKKWKRKMKETKQNNFYSNDNSSKEIKFAKHIVLKNLREKGNTVSLNEVNEIIKELNKGSYDRLSCHVGVIIDILTMALDQMEQQEECKLSKLKREDIIREAIETYGLKDQLVMVMEECSELQKECSKAYRGKFNEDNLIEEMADVYIMLKQLAIMFDISDEELDVVTDKKLCRLEKRLNEKNGL